MSSTKFYSCLFVVLILSALSGPAQASCVSVIGTYQVLNDYQSAQVGTAFGEPLFLGVTCNSFPAFEGIPIIWTVQAGIGGAGPTLPFYTSFTDPVGVTLISPIANGIAGSYTITAIAPNSVPLYVFHLTNTPAPPNVAVVSGSAQSAVVGVAFPTALTVLVRDGATPAANVKVTFAAPESGASAVLSALTATTDVNGNASITVAANHIVGAYPLTASVPGAAAPAVFSLINTVGAPDILAAHSPLAQSAGVSSLFATSVAVKVTDMYGNPELGIPITFAAPPSGPSASLPAVLVNTNLSGIAGVYPVANTVLGSYTVTASTPGLETIHFTLTNTSSDPALVSATSGSPQTASLGDAFGAALVASVTDAHGNSAAGAVVRFSAPAAGASALLSLPAVTTDSTGHAHITVTAGQTAGLYSVVATVAGVAVPAIFALTNSATPDISIAAIVSSADFRSGAAPGALLTIFGHSLARSLGDNAPLPWPTVVGGVIVTVNGEPVPLYYVSPSQINFQLPAGVPLGQATVVVSHDSASSSPYTLEVSSLAPAMFVSATNHAAALDTAYAVNNDTHPAAPGSVLLLYATGQATVAPPVPDGEPAPFSPLSKVTSPVSVTVGGLPATVLFAGLTPGSVGLLQVNIEVPAGLAPGDYATVLTIGGVSSLSALVSVGAAP